jgi:RimJ/RimL family protein N-acetyltransferase
MTNPVLETERLRLQPVSPKDFDDLKDTWADPVFVAAITGRPLSSEDVWFRLLRDIGHWQVTGYGNWSMRLRATGAYVGSVGVFDYRRELNPPFEAPELGWGVRVAHQGQGLAHEGLSALLEWTDSILKPERTVCMIAPDNHPSLRLASRVGYKPYALSTYKDGAVHLFERPRGAAASGKAP